MYLFFHYITYVKFINIDFDKHHVKKKKKRYS